MHGLGKFKVLHRFGVSGQPFFIVAAALLCLVDGLFFVNNEPVLLHSASLLSDFKLLLEELDSFVPFFQ